MVTFKLILAYSGVRGSWYALFFFMSIYIHTEPLPRFGFFYSSKRLTLDK
jgi:hypothetical protein